MYFLKFLISVVLIDHIESVDEFFFPFNGKDRKLIKIADAHLVFDILDVLPSGFADVSLCVYFADSYDRLSIVFFFFLV